MAKVTDTVAALALPVVEAAGCSLWDVEYVKEAGCWFLRVYIDKEEGVSIDDCEKMSRAVDEPLDKLDPVREAYILEVSSPGIERELTREEHFERFKGADIMVRLIRPMEILGKEFKGVLKDFTKDTITVVDHSGENEVTVNRKDTAWVKLDDFEM